jgi:hypothetical protein
MLPGLKPGRRILVMARTNTYGVQAFAEFVCRADLVGELLSRLHPKRDTIPDFEALVGSASAAACRSIPGSCWFRLASGCRIDLLGIDANLVVCRGRP